MVLGHLLRGGSPTALDRLLGLRFGAAAVRAIEEGQNGMMVGLQPPDVVYVPLGLCSGICGMLAARDALGLGTEVVGVVSAHATAYAESFAARTPVEAPVSTRLADGMACRVVEPAALELILAGVERIVRVTDAEIAGAMKLLFECTHNVAEGAGAAAVAAATQEMARIAGRRIGVVLSGANVDREIFVEVLAGADPAKARG